MSPGATFSKKTASASSRVYVFSGGASAAGASSAGGSAAGASSAGASGAGASAAGASAAGASAGFGAGADAAGLGLAFLSLKTQTVCFDASARHCSIASGSVTRSMRARYSASVRPAHSGVESISRTRRLKLWWFGGARSLPVTPHLATLVNVPDGGSTSISRGSNHSEKCAESRWRRSASSSCANHSHSRHWWNFASLCASSHSSRTSVESGLAKKIAAISRNGIALCDERILRATRLSAVWSGMNRTSYGGGTHGLRSSRGGRSRHSRRCAGAPPAASRAGPRPDGRPPSPRSNRSRPPRNPPSARRGPLPPSRSRGGLRQPRSPPPSYRSCRSKRRRSGRSLSDSNRDAMRPILAEWSSADVFAQSGENEKPSNKDSGIWSGVPSLISRLPSCLACGGIETP